MSRLALLLPTVPAASYLASRVGSVTELAGGLSPDGGVLYVADTEAHRVQVFEIGTLALVGVYGGLTDVADVAAGERGVYVLDRSEAC